MRVEGVGCRAQGRDAGWGRSGGQRESPGGMGRAEPSTITPTPSPRLPFRSPEALSRPALSGSRYFGLGWELGAYFWLRAGKNGAGAARVPEAVRAPGAPPPAAPRTARTRGAAPDAPHPLRPPGPPGAWEPAAPRTFQEPRDASAGPRGCRRVRGRGVPWWPPWGLRAGAGPPVLPRPPRTYFPDEEAEAGRGTGWGLAA